MLLEPVLIELRIVEGAELRSEVPKDPDQPELSGDDVDDETVSDLAHELEPGLGLALHVGERLPAGQEVRDRHEAAEAGVREIAEAVGDVKGAQQQAAAGAKRLRPGKDGGPEDLVDTGFEPA